MPLYQFTKAGTGEVTRRDLVLGDDLRAFLDPGTYAVSRVEPETLSPEATVTLAVVEPIEVPEEPVEPVEPVEPEEPIEPEEPVEPEEPAQSPQVLLPGDGTIEVEIQNGTTLLTIAGTGIYDGEYAVGSTGFTTGPVNLVPASVSGTAKVGETLFATPGLWVYASSNGNFAVAGRWQRDGVDIADATAPVRDVISSDAGKALRYVEAATDGAGAREAVSGNVAIPSAPAVPTFSGPMSFGPQLRAWWDYEDRATHYRDVAQMTAVTADGQIVLGIADKSGQGNHIQRHDTVAAQQATAQAGHVMMNEAAFRIGSNFVGITNDMTIYALFDHLGARLTLAGIPQGATPYIAQGISGNAVGAANGAGSGMVYYTGQNIVPITTRGNVFTEWGNKGMLAVAVRGVDLTTTGNGNWISKFGPFANSTLSQTLNGRAKQFAVVHTPTDQQHQDMMAWLTSRITA